MIPMAYAFQDRDSELAGGFNPTRQKTIQPVRAPGETPAPATIGLGAPPARVYAPPAANPYAPTGTPPPPTAAPRAWFNDPNANWSYDSEIMARQPEALGAVNLAALIRDKAKALGYSGGGMWGDTVDNISPGGDQSPVRSVNPDFQNWLTSNNYQLGGESVGINGIGGVNAFITDSTGKRISEQSYASDDSGFFNFGVGLLGLGAFSAVNAAAGLGAEAAALPESQIGAMSGNPFLTTELSGLTAPTASELAAITPSIPSIGSAGAGAGLFSNAGAEALAASGAEFGPTAAEVSAITPDVAGLGSGAAGLGSLAVPPESVAAYENALPGAAGGSLTSQIGSALSGVKSFIKENPQLAALGASGAATLLGGTPDKPALPGSGSGAGAGGTSNDALIQRLTEQLYGKDGSMSKAFDYSSVPGLKTSAGDAAQINQQAMEAAYSAQTRMLDPQFQRERQGMEARLAEQGFIPGTPGYERAMSIFGEQQNKAYGAARDSSILQGYNIGQGQFGNQLSNAQLNNNASNSTLAQLLQERNQPLNELNSLKTGQQLAYENQLGQYNADVGSANSRNQALSQLALALGMYLG